MLAPMVRCFHSTGVRSDFWLENNPFHLADHCPSFPFAGLATSRLQNTRLTKVQFRKELIL